MRKKSNHKFPILSRKEFEEYEKSLNLTLVPNERLINERVTRLRTLRGWTAIEFVRRVGGLNPRADISFGSEIGTIMRLAVTLGTSVEYLTGQAYLDDSLVDSKAPPALDPRPPDRIPRAILFMTLRDTTEFVQEHKVHKGPPKKLSSPS